MAGGRALQRAMIERIEARIAASVGSNFELTQPIEMPALNELLAGVRGDVAIKLFGEDLDEMTRVARQIGAVVQDVPRVEDLRIDQTEGFPTLDMRFTATPSPPMPRPRRCGRHDRRGVRRPGAGAVFEAIAASMCGEGVASGSR